MNPEGVPPTNRAEDHEDLKVPNLEKEPLLPMPELQNEEIENYIHAHSMGVGFEGAKDRVIEILKIVQEDEQAVKMINETLETIIPLH